MKSVFAWLVNGLRGSGYGMTERQSSSKERESELHVHTSRDGRKYVDPNELIRTKKARRQRQQVREMFVGAGRG
jgi:hypothetical protein